jgi:hypothetical protein
MVYRITNGIAGSQPIATTSTVQNHPFGTIVEAVDPTYGSGEFIYLKGVGSTIVGSWVSYSPDDWSTLLLAPNAIGPVAVAMSANVASQYGWYQIGGKAIAKAADVADSGKVYIDTAAGVCDDAVVTGDRVTNAKWASADDTATGTAEVRLARPFVTDQKDAT